MNDGPKLKPDLDMTPAAKIEIVLNRQGVTQISGPLLDKAICYAMLIESIFMVREFKPGPAAPVLTLAKEMPKP